MENIGEADDGIERRAQLMAHVGEEAGFGEIAASESRAQMLEFHLVLLALGDIAGNGHHRVVAQLVGQMTHVRFDPDPAIDVLIVAASADDIRRAGRPPGAAPWR